MSATDYRLINDTSEVSAACEALSRHAALGFDTETTALDPYEGRLRLVQLAAPDGVIIFDLDRLAPGGGAERVEALEPLRRLLAAKTPVKIAHNCLAGDMLVSMTDGTKVRIDELVRAKTRGQVLCLDEQTGRLSSGEIVDWVDAGIRPWDDWLRVRLRGKGRLRVTKDHEILTERGRVRAENLLPGDRVLTSLPELSRPQKDMLYGSLLGDGSLTKQRGAQARTPHFKVSHSTAQEGYVALKAAALDGLVKHIKTEKPHRRGFSNNERGSQLISLTTRSDPRLFELYDNCLVGDKRTLTPGWLDNLSMPAVAIWYCDDGSLSGGSSVRICVSAFGAEGADALSGFLRSKGFPAKQWVRPDGQLYIKVAGPLGRGMSEELKRFWENIAPYVPVSMQYKLPAAYKHLASDTHWTTPSTGRKAFSDTVVEVLPLLNDSEERGRYEGYRRGNRRGLRQYCLTVASHRNFIAGGLAVSNCKFDAKWVRQHLGVELNSEFDSRENGNGVERVERAGLFDTLLASQIVSAGEPEDRHSLASVAERYLGEALDKSQQVSDWGGELSESQLTYAARDASVMLPLRDKLIEQLRANALGRCAQLEFECVAPVAAMELAGIFLDKERWREQLAIVEKKRELLAEELQQELAEESPQQSFFGPTRMDINLDSHVQLTKALTRLGVPVPDSTRNWKLQPLALEYPIVRKLLDYRTVQKALTSYGENILREISPVTGRIHANFHQIGAPTGRFACLAGDTLVTTPAGFKRMSEVRAGDAVKTSYGFKRVENAWMTGTKQLFRVRLKDGRSIRATAEHRFLTGRANEWKRLDELRPGDSVFVSLKVSEFAQAQGAPRINLPVPEVRSRQAVRLPEELSPSLCELMGLIVADGFLGRRRERPVKRGRLSGTPAVYDRVYLAFDWQDEELMERVVQYSLELFGQPFVPVKSKTCRVLQLPSTRVAHFFAALGLEGNAHTKTVPEVILRAPISFQAAFLRGLFEGDGYRTDDRVGLTSVNFHLLSQVQLMLSNLGVYATIKQRKDTTGFSGSCRYDLEVHKKTDLVRFVKQVGFISGRKNRPLTLVPQITDGLPTPFVVPGAQLYREAVAAGRTQSSRQGIKPFVTHYKGAYLKDESVRKLVSRFGVLPSLEPVVDYLALQVRPVGIESIIPDGIEEVYDITVEDVHEFIAEGIVVHNCTNPNVQQVPHSIEYRRCFRAQGPNRKLVIADYSQIELRILADFTGDKGFIDAFQSGADLHRVTAAQVFAVPLEEVTKVQRDFAKRLNFGVVYGIGAQRFALMTGLSQTEAEDILRRYFATYRALDAWLRDAANKAVRERTAPRTVAGRLFRFNFDPEDRQAASLAQRNGKNSPIQGCVSGDTRVFERRAGYVPIKELAGRAVTVWDGSKFVKALAAYSGQKRLVRVEFWGGHYIECSPDHKFLTTDVNGRTRWRTPGEFVKGNYVLLTAPPDAWGCDLSLPEPRPGRAWHACRASLAEFADRFELGVFMGRTASDGSVSPRQITNLVAEHEIGIMPYMQRLAGRLGHVTVQRAKKEPGRKPLYELTNSSLSVAGQLLGVGIKSRVPDPAWRDRRVLAGYLRGMFDGDGTVNKDGPVLTFGKKSTHLAWAREIQQALLLFGIRSRVNVCADRVNVRVLKRDAGLFAAEIGFINRAKQEKLNAVKSGLPLSAGKIYGRAVRIKSVDVTDEHVEMYDIVDSESGRFMANGLVVHNSSADIIKRAMRILHDELRGTTDWVVNVVHDEIVVETDAARAEETAKVVEDAMCRAGKEYVKKVPVKVESVVADEWVK